MGLMSLAISSGSEVALIANGSDETEAIEALISYISHDA